MIQKDIKNKIPALVTKRLILKPFEIKDAVEVANLCNDIRIADTTLTIPHPYEQHMATVWIATHQKRFADGLSMTLAVFKKENEQLVGTVDFVSFNQEHLRANIGYWIGVPYWGNGYATESLRELIKYGFQQLGLTRIQGDCLTRNSASAHVMEKAGMLKEGCLRKHIKKNDVFEDISIYGLLKDEFV